jgi:hypothetical protein
VKREKYGAGDVNLNLANKTAASSLFSNQNKPCRILIVELMFLFLKKNLTVHVLSAAELNDAVPTYS